MPQLDSNHVKIVGCTIVWDGMTKPDTNESGTKHHFKVVVPPNNPDIALLEQLANQKLMESEFKGTLPARGTMPVVTLGPNEYDGMFNGWKVFTCGTYRGVPPLYIDEVYSDMLQAGTLIFPGQLIDVAVHCYANNGAVKGIAVGLDAFNIQKAANAQRQNFGGPTFDHAAAFGGAPADQPAPAATPQAAGHPQQATNFLPGAQNAAPAAPAASPASPAPSSPAPPVEMFLDANGNKFTREQLQAANYSDDMINQLQRA